MTILTRFSGTLYPDKSFSLGVVPRAKKTAQDRAYDRSYRAQEPRAESERLDWYEGKVSLEGKVCSVTEGALLVKSPKSSPKSRGSYGKKGITNFGKRVVKNTALLLQKAHGTKCLGFGTATLPRMCIEANRFITASWGEVCRRFFQKLSRLYKKRNRKFIYISVTEIQEKRFRATGIPVCHLHFVFVAKPNLFHGYTMDTKEAFRRWNEAVNEVLVIGGFVPIMGNNEHIGSVKLEAIRKSAASYLGKYMSKGVDVVNAMIEAGYTEFPRQWWSACMHAKKLFKDSLIRLTSKECEAIFYGLEELLHEGSIVWGRFVDIIFNDEYVRIGCVGTMSDCMHAMFKG